MTELLPEAQDLLDFSELAFGYGDIREGSRLVWKAVQVSITTVATKYDWPCSTLDEIKEVVYRLDDIDETRKSKGYSRYFALFTVADIFREHAETDEWEYPEFQWSPVEFRVGRKSIVSFLTLLTEHSIPDNKRQ